MDCTCTAHQLFGNEGAIIVITCPFLRESWAVVSLLYGVLCFHSALGQAECSLFFLCYPSVCCCHPFAIFLSTFPSSMVFIIVLCLLMRLRKLSCLFHMFFVISLFTFSGLSTSSFSHLSVEFMLFFCMPTFQWPQFSSYMLSRGDNRMS